MKRTGKKHDILKTIINSMFETKCQVVQKLTFSETLEQKSAK